MLYVKTLGILVMGLISFYWPDKATYDAGTITATKWSATVNPSQPFNDRGKIHFNQTRTARARVSSGPFRTLQEARPKRVYDPAWTAVSMPTGTVTPATTTAQGSLEDFRGLEYFFESIVYGSALEFDFLKPNGDVDRVQWVEDILDFTQEPYGGRYSGRILLRSSREVCATYYCPAPERDDIDTSSPFGADPPFQALAEDVFDVPSLGPNVGHRSLMSWPVYNAGVAPGSLIGKKMVLLPIPAQEVGFYSPPDGNPVYGDGTGLVVHIPFGTPLEIVDHYNITHSDGIRKTAVITWSSDQNSWAIGSWARRAPVDMQIVK